VSRRSLAEMAFLVWWSRLSQLGGTRGCPGSGPLGARSVTATRWSARAPMPRAGGEPGRYQKVARRMFGRGGRIRPWTPGIVTLEQSWGTSATRPTGPG
jgi:hypothetical protein